MAEWIGQEAVKGLLQTLASYLKYQFDWEANVKSALKNLETTLLPISVALENAEKRELNLDQNPSLGEWLWKLRDAVEEAEDVLDDMEYDRLDRQILKRDTKEEVLAPVAAASSGFKLKLIKFFKVHGFGCSTSLFKHSCIKFGKKALLMDPTLDKLNDAVENLRQVSEKINLFNDVIDKSPSRWGGNKNITTNKRETVSDLTVDKVIGRDKDKLKVLELLKESESERISALTISGVGGVGKTTLAQFVFNDDSLNFEVKMWVCVSNNNDDMVVLVKKAIETATNKRLPDTASLPSLIRELKDIVKSKICLLVLDDVWEDQSNQNRQQWEIFISVLSNHSKKGSRIIITSRTESVAEIVLQSLAIKKKSFLLRCLQEDESLSLFYKHAFAGAHLKDQKVLKPVGQIIAMKCGGLPLALKIMGGLLNAKLEYIYWDSISKKNIVNVGADVKEILKLSYQCLPSSLQSCFKICSLFPQDYKFKEDELIELWIGLGCISQSKDKNTQTAEDIGQDHLVEMVRRSFFVYDSEFYTMHDLLHDLARDVSKDECLRVEGNESVVLPKTLRHLFVDQLNSNLIIEISSLKSLRTLALTYNYSTFSSHSHFHDYDYDELVDTLKQLGSLHALFICIETMPDLSIIQPLKHLRLFHMKVSTLNKPLKPLYKLYQLQNLKCEEVREPSEVHNARHQIEYRGIGSLVKLRHLVLPPRIFDQITELRHLTELQKIELHLKKDNALKLSDLKELNKLHHLIINCNCETTSFEEAKETNLVEKEHLEALSLNWIKCDPYHHEEIYNCLHPRKKSNIKCLTLNNYSGLRAPKWMTSSYLPFVTSLTLSECDNMEHLPPLGQLQSLKYLKLENIGVKQSGAEFFGSDDMEGFQSLEHLSINKMIYLEEWTNIENSSWFPCLKELYIDDCPQLEALPALPLSLKILHINSVGLVALPLWQDVYEDVGSPSLEDLDISSCEELVYIQPFLVKCAFLENMKLKNCPKILLLDDMPSSLRNLELFDCPMLELLPKMLSSLMKLWICGCPLLWKWYHEGGPFWHNIAQIPDVLVAENDEDMTDQRAQRFIMKFYEALRLSKS